MCHADMDREADARREADLQEALASHGPTCCCEECGQPFDPIDEMRERIQELLNGRRVQRMRFALVVLGAAQVSSPEHA